MRIVVRGHKNISTPIGPKPPIPQKYVDGWNVGCGCGWNGGVARSWESASSLYREHAVNVEPLPWPDEQTCSRCRQSQQLSEFPKSKLASKGVSTTCKPCLRELSKEHYAADKDAYLERNAKWYEDHPGKRREYARQYRLRNIEKVRTKARENAAKYAARLSPGILKQRAREQYVKHRDKRTIERLARYAANPDAEREKSRLWRNANPDKVAEITARNKTKRANLPGTFTAAEWRHMKNIYDNKCLSCGCGGKMTVDHVIPVALGGTGFISNIQPLCETCNKKKNAKHIDYRTSFRLSIEEVLFLISGKTRQLEPRIN